MFVMMYFSWELLGSVWCRWVSMLLDRLIVVICLLVCISGIVSLLLFVVMLSMGLVVVFVSVSILWILV